MAESAAPGILRGDSPGLRLARRSLALIALCAVLLPFADLAVVAHDPWVELGRMAAGLALPHWRELSSPLHAIGLTVSVALWGTLLGVLLGFPLALVFFRSRLVRAGCAFVRAIHELFWALLFLQVFGLSAVTALAALAVPYAGIFAKVYAEILEQTPAAAADSLPPGVGRLSRFVYAELPLVWERLAAYTRYRFECSLRASVLLGFVGLPTLGFHLESAFREGHYHEAGALLWLFYLLIGSIGLWAHRRLLPLLALGCLFLLGPWPDVDAGLLWRFVSHDLWPAPLLNGDPAGLVAWLGAIPDLGPAIGNTLLLGLMGTVGALVIALLLWPLASRHFGNRASRLGGSALLIGLRSTPELMLAFIFLLLLGPSMLPAWLALALHNGALIAFLAARHADGVEPGMPDLTASGRYAYELLPRIYPGLLALLFYRAEVIIRETALLGMLGVATLGFHIDSSFQYLMFDQAFFLLLVTAGLNIVVDTVARRYRPREVVMDDPCSR
ncbi:MULTISPECIES: ABC transporter permease [unclassified Modicisalibacter]|uniref:PhnE/PtxC family ABC transporter permease n=1 Tax=unclassified Modicisalibacter TaxID=2679913 RepID=UPI001CCCC7C5|nr:MULTISPECIES: ABC transporter permease [unclassified Modicisalibacter]MBZ9559948.1 ABC transporter permease [Modicisalibacter sp. R2A 31.J]MBZ9575856.1 ABC transporter permease [Modicisalibacter sp. MOD 31.J]